MRKVLFRADGSTVIGLGHVIRSLALAEMLKAEFHCAFAIQNPSISLQHEILAVCSELILLPEDPTDLEVELDPYLNGTEIVVLDGYKFGTTYQRRVKNKGCSLVCIDDIHDYHFLADAVVNHGIVDGSCYSIEPSTVMLLGTDYCLLRKPFLQSINDDYVPRIGNQAFLCFGGSDILNLTGKYLDWMLQIGELETVHVVVGSAYQHLVELQQLQQCHPEGRIQIHYSISAEQMVEVILNCRVAIVPGSTIAIECASTGIPMMCGYYVGNQLEIVQMLDKKGLAYTVGDFVKLEERKFASTVCKLLKQDLKAWHLRSKFYFDGKSQERFLKVFDHLFRIKKITLRRALESDLELFFNWANDPAVRMNAINETLIPYESHCAWFAKKVHSHDSLLYVASTAEGAFGQVRFDYNDNCYHIDYSINSHMRGRGLGVPMLQSAICKLYEDLNKPFTLNAVVKVGNVASEKIFRKLQFTSQGTKRIDGSEYLLFEKKIG